MSENQNSKKSAAFTTFKDTLDGTYPGLILSINAARLGMDATVFYTFMGINVIRKGLIEKTKFQQPEFMGAIPDMSAVATWMKWKKRISRRLRIFRKSQSWKALNLLPVK